MPSSTCVVVLGGHRCGTSAVAGVLHHLGVFMGYRLVGASKSNRLGHFEDIAFLDLHKKIVGSWKRPCVKFDPVRRARERVFTLWGFKDPRFCLVFPHFRRIVKARLLVVSIHRDLEAAAFSMAARRSTSNPSIHVTETQAKQIARRYHDAQIIALRLHRGPALAVHYEQLVEKPAKQVAAIAKFVGLPVTEKAINFIDPRLKHH
jgi:hypothetical protein